MFGCRSIALPAAICLALHAVCSSNAQNTWIVDAAGGTGANFADLPPAIAAAADGDILHVRPGSYSPFVLARKGLRVMGEDPATTRVDRIGSVTIGPTAMGQNVWIEGIGFELQSIAATQAPTVSVLDTVGGVVLRRVNIAPRIGAYGLSSSWGLLELRRCAQVHLLECDVRGSSAIVLGIAPSATGIDAVDSLLEVASCRVSGGTGGPAPMPGGNAIDLTRGKLFAIASQIWGGNGIQGCSATLAPPGVGGAAIDATGGAEVIVFGRSSSHVVRGGNGGRDCDPRHPWADGGPGLILAGGSATFEGLTPIGGYGIPLGPAYVLQSGAAISIRSMNEPPIAWIEGVPAVSGIVTLRLAAAAGSTAFLALSWEHRFTMLPAGIIGPLLLATTPMIVLSPHAMSGTTWDYRVDLVPGWPYDLPIVAQYLVVDANGVFLSNSVALVLHSP